MLHTWCFCRRNFSFFSSGKDIPDNLVARVELVNRINRMDHLPKDHSRTQRDQGVGHGIVADEIPSHFFGDHFRRTVRDSLSKVISI